MRYEVFNAFWRLYHETGGRVEQLIADHLEPFGWPPPDDMTVTHEMEEVTSDDQSARDLLTIDVVWYTRGDETVSLEYTTGETNLVFVHRSAEDAEDQRETVATKEEIEELAKRWWGRFFPKAWTDEELSRAQ